MHLCFLFFLFQEQRLTQSSAQGSHTLLALLSFDVFFFFILHLPSCSEAFSELRIAFIQKGRMLLQECLMGDLSSCLSLPLTSITLREKTDAQSLLFLNPLYEKLCEKRDARVLKVVLNKVWLLKHLAADRHHPVWNSEAAGRGFGLLADGSESHLRSPNEKCSVVEKHFLS